MKNILILSVISVLGITSYFLYTAFKEKNEIKTDDSTQVVDIESHSDTTVNNPTQDEDVVQVDNSIRYVEYSESELLKEGKNVIFFKADWCPSCRGLDSDITKNIDDIPKDFLILKADYDKETKLKAKYGVTLQHTLVVVDSSGNLVKKLSGLYVLNTLDDLISAVNGVGN